MPNDRLVFARNKNRAKLLQECAASRVTLQTLSHFGRICRTFFGIEFQSHGLSIDLFKIQSQNHAVNQLRLVRGSNRSLYSYEHTPRSRGKISPESRPPSVHYSESTRSIQLGLRKSTPLTLPLMMPFSFFVPHPNREVTQAYRQPSIHFHT